MSEFKPLQPKLEWKSTLYYMSMHEYKKVTRIILQQQL